MGYTTYKGQRVWIEPNQNVDMLGAAICINAVDDYKAHRKDYLLYKDKYEALLAEIKVLEIKYEKIRGIEAKYRTKEQERDIATFRESLRKKRMLANSYEAKLFPYFSARDYICSKNFEIYAGISGETALEVLNNSKKRSYVKKRQSSDKSE